MNKNYYFDEVMLNVISKEKRDVVARHYANGLGIASWNMKKIDGEIVKKWNNKSLKYIKDKAWKIYEEKMKNVDWYLGYKDTLKEINEEKCKCFKSYFYQGDLNGYGDNKIEILLYEDGAMAFSSDGEEHFIYLYPKQINHLKKVLKKL